MDDFKYLPKYIQVKKSIEKAVEDRLISPGDKMPTESELTRMYSVSRHTVRKALDILGREGVLEKKQGIGTFYKGKCSNQSRNIGFISISLYEYIFADILTGIDNILHENAYQIILGNSQDNLNREKVILEQFMEKDIDGLIIEPAKSALSQSNISLLNKFLENRIPIVVLDSDYGGNLNNVLVDDQKGGIIATEYLIKKGHRRIAMIYKRIHKPAVARFAGYKKALQMAGLSLKDKFIKPYNNSEFEYHDKFKEEIKLICHELLELEEPPTAIFCFNDQIAILVSEILLKSGVYVPEDISLVGFDDSSLVSLNTISITSVSHPKKKGGEKAAQIILSEIEKDQVNSGIKKIFEPILVERNSVLKI